MTPARRLRRSIAAAAVLTLGAWAAAGQQDGRAPGAAAAAPSAPVIVGAVEGPIGPAAQRHVEKLLGRAAELEAEALVLRLDTPGGLTDTTRRIIERILASPVPVIGWVAPPGAHAASAGTYILYATHLAAMAPGTNIGAATPVQMGAPGLPGGDRPDPAPDAAPERGEDAGDGTPESDAEKPRPRVLSGESAMTAKVTNDAVAFIRSLAEMHGRNADWAERAVREAASLSATGAEELGVVEIVAADLDELLAKTDGRTVTVLGRDHTFATAGAPVETVDVGTITRILGVVSNPNVAIVLMTLGIYGIIYEFVSGTGVAGVTGAICLALGLYGMNQLPLDYAGLALLGFGIVLMVAEALSPSFGVLGFGGLASFVIGSAMLVDTDVPEYQLSWGVIGTMALISGVVLVLLLGVSWRAYRRAPPAANTMVGIEAEVLDWTAGEGHVHASGERWRATGPAGLAPGQRVRVHQIDGLILTVG